MASAYQPRALVYSKLEFVSPSGSSTYDLGPFSPGYDSWVKTDTVKRVKPRNLIEPGSLTHCGPHQRQRLIKAPVTVVYGPDQWGGSVIYKDMDPGNWATVGQAIGQPDVDWQTALRLAVKDQKVNLAVAMAEYPQAQKMFVNNATAIAKALRALRRGDASGAAKALGVKPKQLRGSISNRWLELRYGWMPLLSDLHGSVEELNSGLQRPRTRKLHVRKKEEERIKSSFTIYVPNATTATLDCQWVVTAKVVAYLQQDSLAACRLGVTNPLMVAWELVPYSFVVDWLIPIGDWLNSLDAGIGLINIYGTVTTKAKMIATQTFGSQYYLIENYVRVPFMGLPSPPLPSYKPSLGVVRIANALALLSQLKR